MAMMAEPDRSRCSLILFLATPAEEDGLREAAMAKDLPFDKIKHPLLGEEYHWLGAIGDEDGVIAVRPSRERGQVVMGAIGHLGSAAKAIRFRTETGAQAIVQIGMAFGIDSRKQRPGDVLVSTSLIPYDNRDVRPAHRHPLKRWLSGNRYVVDYNQANRQPSRSALLKLFRKEEERGGHLYNVYVGSLLSGAARIHSRRFRDELARNVPAAEDPIVGGEMEGVGLLAASIDRDDPIWCVVKGISDFADEGRDSVINANRPVACRNAADFVLSALINGSTV